MKFLTSLLMFCVAGVAFADPLARAQDSLDRAAQNDITEVAAGQLAMKKATDPKVREFAETLVKERRLTHQLLKALAVSQQVVLPKEPRPEQRRKLQVLQMKKGADFEAAYVAGQIAAHRQWVDLLKAEIELIRS